MSCGRLSTFGQDLGIGVLISEFVYQFIGYEIGVTRRIDSYLCQHLMTDNLDVFIVNGHTLRTVYLLYFVNQVLLYCLLAQNMQNILWVCRAVSKLLPCLYPVSGLNTNMGSRGNNILPLLFLLIYD